MSVPCFKVCPILSGCQTLLPVEYRAAPLILTTLPERSVAVCAERLAVITSASPHATNQFMIRFVCFISYYSVPNKLPSGQDSKDMRFKVKRKFSKFFTALQVARHSGRNWT